MRALGAGCQAWPSLSPTSQLAVWTPALHCTRTTLSTACPSPPFPTTTEGHDDGGAARDAATAGREAGTFFPCLVSCLPFAVPPSPQPTPHTPPLQPLPRKASFEQALRSQAKKAQRHSYTLFLRRPCLCLFFLLLLLVPFLNGLLLLAFGGCYHRNVFFFLAK